MATELELVVARYQEAYGRLRLGTAAAVLAAWARFGGPDDEAEARFVAAAVPLVGGAQVAVVRLLAGYMATMARAAIGQALEAAPAAEKVTGAALRGVDLVEVYRRPVVTMRTALARGELFMDAKAKAGERAAVLAQTDVALAQRAATSAVLEGGRRITGYRRVLSGSSCSLCAQAAARRHTRREPMPIHGRCDCGVAPVFGRLDPASGLNRRRLDELEAAGPMPEVATHTHGELGPVLTEAAHSFTGPSDL